MEREVSLPFAPPSPAPARRAIERAESSALRLDVASVLEQRADDIAARWWEDGPALVRCLAAALATRGAAADEATIRGADLGIAAFRGGVALDHLLRAFDAIVSRCLDIVEDAVNGTDARVEPADAMHVCRTLLEVAESIRVAAARGFIDAAEQALQERFRSLRHDLRNPISTIRSALSLMADETVPEDARRSPRFPAMIERNTTALDQLIVARLNDSEARLLPATRVRGAESASASLGLGEARDDLARSRERDDRQAGPL